jgi:DNA helicase-2/ATP-dependent DNA helicase PcrA
LRLWYDPLLAALYESAHTRFGDLDQLERIAAQHPTRVAFLNDIALDPPEAVGGEAGPPVKDEDWLVLSTIHSAKGQEWRAVYVLNVVDGCIPSDLATGTAEEIEEERRLLFVAMSRAKDYLAMMQPMRFYVRGQASGSDKHVYAPRSRFLMDEDLGAFELVSARPNQMTANGVEASAPRIDLKAAMRGMWGRDIRR